MIRMIRRAGARPLPVIAVAASMGAAAPGHAQSATDNGWIQVSLYRPVVDSSIQVDGQQNGVQGSIIDLEDDLHLSRSKILPALSAGVRIGRSWTLLGDIYQLNRSNSTIIDQDISYDGVEYPVSATVKSEFNSQIYRLAVGYSVVRNAKTELGFSLGAHVTRFKTSLEGEVIAADGSRQITRRSHTILAPLPTIGIFASQQIAPRVTLAGKVDLLSLKIGDYKGKLANIQASVGYRFTRSLSVGAMYRYVDYRLEVRKDEWSGKVRYRFHGPSLFAQMSW